MQLLGIDIGSSSVKAAIIDAQSGDIISAAQYPEKEMEITAIKPGWAEQEPEMWFANLKNAIKKALSSEGVKSDTIGAIGISYQMHGLVLVDKNQKVLRSSIIWCDSRAAQIGEKAFDELGGEWCLKNLLNSPGNFTASKLKWVKENEPAIFDKVDKFMLPGDYIAMMLTGEISTTASGLSEGIFWDFQKDALSEELLAHYGFNKSMVPNVNPTFSNQGVILDTIAVELGLPKGIAVTYRAGDQPNNAFSLNVLNPGEIAATAGTSGVVYGVSDKPSFDAYSRVNSFAHVNHNQPDKRLGILLCINGTGILNSWMKRFVGKTDLSYPEMNDRAATVPIGADGLIMLPFGNGAERVLKNQNPGARVANLSFNTHHDGHMYRAAQEGIAFAFKYGMEIMGDMGIQSNVIKAGTANLFLSPLFRDTLSNVTGATIELYNTDGAAGAARGAGVGAGIYASYSEAFEGLKKTREFGPDASKVDETNAAYDQWKSELNKILQ